MEKSFLTSVILPASLAFIMFGMGLSLTVKDFQRILKFPKAVLVGLSNQIIILPILAWGLVSLMNIESGIAVGVMILAACPGGTTSNLISHVSRGDTALSVTLTAFSTLITFFSIPFIVNLSLSIFMAGNSGEFQLPIMKTLGALFLITILPVSVGMLIGAYFPKFAFKMDKAVRISSVVIFVIIIAGIFAKNKDVVIDFLAQAGGVSVLLLILSMSFGFFSAKLLGATKSQSITISIESGIQNGTMGLLIATELIENASPEFSIPSLTYGLLMFIPAAILMFVFGRKKAMN